MEDISALKERYGQQTRIYKRYNILNVLVPHKSEEFDLHTFLDLEFLSIDTSDKDERKNCYLQEYLEFSIEFRENGYYAKLPCKQ